jgi:hypothetical protein
MSAMSFPGSNRTQILLLTKENGFAMLFGVDGNWDLSVRLPPFLNR